MNWLIATLVKLSNTYKRGRLWFQRTQIERPVCSFPSNGMCLDLTESRQQPSRSKMVFHINPRKNLTSILKSWHCEEEKLFTFNKIITTTLNQTMF
jgi:hypothetical protein